MKSRILLVVLASMLISPGGVAHGMELNTQIQAIKEAVEFIQFALDLKEQYGEVEKLDHIGPSVGTAQVRLDELAKRANSFVPQEQVKPPMLDGADVFSADKKVRDRARREWDRFLDDDANEIARLKEGRSRRQEALDRYRERETALDQAEKALEKALSDRWVSGVFKEDIGFAWYDVTVEAKPRMSGIVSDYERIVRDYDRIIARREVQHEAHVSTGAAVHAMQGADEAKVDSSATKGPGDSLAPPRTKSTNMNTAIKQAVAGPGAAPLAQAEWSRRNIGKMREDRASAEAHTQQAQSSAQTTTVGPGGGGAAHSDGNTGYGAGGNSGGPDMSLGYIYRPEK